MLTAGRAVLPLAAAGKVAPLGDNDASIVWADSLTVPVARAFLASSAKLLVTRTGNPVCHGANLLRVAKTYGREVGWITGLQVEGTGNAVVTHQGQFAASDGQLLVLATSSSAIRAIFEFSSGTRTAVCLWPDRSYSWSEFWMQEPGLALSASDLCNRSVAVSRDARGRIWFESGQLDEEMIKERALDREYSLKCLRDMVEHYDKIASSIRAIPLSVLHREALQGLSKEFFRRLLLFHSCYAEVMTAAARTLGSAIPPSNALDIAAANPISRWLYELDDFRDSSKQGTPLRWWGLLPPNSAARAIEITTELLITASHEGQIALFNAASTEWLATTSVIKELKMVLAKNLFAGLSAITKTSS